MTTSTYGQQIAETTIKYLGGYGKISAMIGAKNFGFDKEGLLRFQFKMFKKANLVTFKVNGKDLYDIKFYKLSTRTGECPLVQEINDLYADQIKKAFEQYTGLYLSL
jgi:hypothetical protein